MLTAALMMGCGDKEEDTGSDTAEAQDREEEDREDDDRDEE